MSRLIVPFDQRKSRPIQFLLPPDRLAALDKVRGDNTTRSEFIREAIDAALLAAGVQP